MLTLDTVVAVVPPTFKTSVTQSLVDKINSMDSDPHVAEAMRDNFLTYSSVLSEGKFKMEEYINAVKFVSLLCMKLNKRDAWIRVFPERYQEQVAKGGDKKTISAHVAMYASGKLVNLITQRVMVPFHVLNQDLRQKALEVQARIMITADSDFVRVTAANSVLQHTTPPKEVVESQINVNVTNQTALQSLEAALVSLAKKQKELIEDGTLTAKKIAAITVVDAEHEPVLK